MAGTSTTAEQVSHTRLMVRRQIVVESKCTRAEIQRHEFTDTDEFVKDLVDGSQRHIGKRFGDGVVYVISC